MTTISARPVVVEDPADRPAVNSGAATDYRDVVAADPWARVRLALVGLYVVGYVVWFKVYGLIIDRISVLISVAILLVLSHVGRSLSRWGRLAVDGVLYSSMWILYDQSRGIADGLGRPLQVESVRNIDRFLFLGNDPSVWLQRHFYSRAVVRWYDVAGSITYYTHFVVPIAAIVVLWITDRREWVRFMRRFASVLLIACVLFVIVPTAPPWMAAGGSSQHQLQALPALARPTARGWFHLDLTGFVRAWETGLDWTNPVAAMPSLHASFSLFVVVFFFPWVRRWPLRVAFLAFPVAMAFSIVYFAEHYVADVFAGWAIVGASFLVWNRVELRARSRRREMSSAAFATLGSRIAPSPP